MARLKYEIDPHNRLVTRETGKKTRISGFRHVIEGRFKIGRGNTLIYHIKAPSGSIAKKYNFPHQLRLKGNWSLTDEHNLRLTLNKWGRQTFGDELILKGEIVKADSSSIFFAVTQRTKEGARSTYILRLEGKWQADKRNRLTFRIKKEKKRHDVLIFDGIWEIDRTNRIIYTYERGKKRHSLLLKGFWNYSRKGVLTYDLDLKGKSHFDFKVGKGIAEKDLIRFELGIGVSRRKKPYRKDFILYGRWKIKRGIGLIFEVRYGSSRLSALRFEAEAELIGRSRIRFALRNMEGQGLGIGLTLSGSMLKGCGESFIRLLRSAKEQAVYIGAGLTW